MTDFDGWWHAKCEQAITDAMERLRMALDLRTDAAAKLTRLQHAQVELDAAISWARQGSSEQRDRVLARRLQQ